MIRDVSVIYVPVMIYAKRKVGFFFYELKSFLLISPKVIKLFGIF